MFTVSCRLLKGQDTEAGVSYFGSSLEREQVLEEIILLFSILYRIPFPHWYLFCRRSVYFKM